MSKLAAGHRAGHRAAARVCVCIYIYTYIYTHIYICVYIYIHNYVWRARERERERQRELSLSLPVFVHMIMSCDCVVVSRVCFVNLEFSCTVCYDRLLFIVLFVAYLRIRLNRTHRHVMCLHRLAVLLSLSLRRWLRTCPATLK